MTNDSPLAFVTGNVGKFRVVSGHLQRSLEQVELHLDEVQSLDISYIAHKKAEAAYALLHRPLLVDDAGLYIHAWHDFPGPFVKHIETAGGQELMLQMLASCADRRAHFAVVVAYHDGHDIHIGQGRMDGAISSEIRGVSWGFNGIFIPDGYTETMAQLAERGVRFDSHRHQALDMLLPILDR